MPRLKVTLVISIFYLLMMNCCWGFPLQSGKRKCLKPVEVDQIIFDCWPTDTNGGFPASTASCNCNKRVKIDSVSRPPIKLKCGEDGTWKAANVTHARNCPYYYTGIEKNKPVNQTNEIERIDNYKSSSITLEIIIPCLFALSTLGLLLFFTKWLKDKQKCPCWKLDAGYINSSEIQSSPSLAQNEALPNRAEPIYLEPLFVPLYDQVAKFEVPRYEETMNRGRTASIEEPEYAQIGAIAQYDDVAPNLPPIPHQQISCGCKILNML